MDGSHLGPEGDGGGSGGGGGSGTVTSVAATDASIVVSGTPSVAPTIATGTLDVIATLHAAAAAVPLNAQKITGLANGSGAQDAAAFGQIPTALPPNGSAGGDLSGTYPNPGVAQVHGVAITSANATLLSQLNNATSRSASATVAAGENTVFTGSTAAQTLTLPTAPQNSSINCVTNSSTQTVTLAAGGADTINYNGTVGSITVPVGGTYSLVYNTTGTVWYVFDAGQLNTQGTGSTVLATSPTLTTPTLGVATATSINKMAVTAPATGSTIAVADGKTLTASNSLTLAGTDSTTMTFPATSSTVLTLASTATITGPKTFNVAGNVGNLLIAGTTSGSTVLNATATASGTLTLPAVTDTLVARTTTDTLTNKTLTTPTINGATITGTATAVKLTYPNNAVTAVSNAATVPITSNLTTVTNNSAATLTITITTGATDGQILYVRVVDFSAASQTITWVNTQSGATPAATTTGTVNIPRVVTFMYISAATKWQCIASV